MKVFIFLLAGALFATVNEPLRWEFFSGYRNDSIHWHSQNPGDGGEINYTEVYRDVEYWLNGLALKVISRDLTFFLRGSYGTFGKGNLKGDVRSTTHGWASDVLGYFGYAVNLTADRTYKVLFTPLIGYGGFFEELKRSALTGHFRQVWNGFFLGGEFYFDTGGPLLMNAGYSYNFLHNRVRAQIPNGTLKTSSGGNGGQTGWAAINWRCHSYWRIGLGGEIHYFFTRVVDASLEHLSQKFKLRWTPISGWAQISRTF